MSEPKTPDEFKGAYFQLRKCASDLSIGCARLQTERDELRKALAERDAKIEKLMALDRPRVDKLNRLTIENGRLAAKLAALEGQEPMAWLVYSKGSHRYSTLTFDVSRVPDIFVGGDVVALYAAAGAAPNAWKEAILDVMTIYGMDAPTTDAPEKILKDLIELATKVAIDSAAGGIGTKP